MLKRVGGEINPEGAVTTISKASFPVPFPAGLEFNSPAHGNWNIVHTGMLMPEAIQIYVCADNCMRGVVLTAAEMNAAEENKRKIPGRFQITKDQIWIHTDEMI